jgi:Mlc titration factor MtfA (ptsG expression regulator)
MPVLIIGVVIAIIIFSVSAIWHHRHVARQRSLRARPFPPQWQAILEQNFTLYPHLPSNLRAQLHQLINVFMAEKTFEGCGGLEITEEMEVSIAAQACLLLLNRELTDVYPDLHTILVYPNAYVAESPRLFAGQVIREPSARAGESWTRGEVVLAWDHVEHGAHAMDDGHNVVMHEFAHQLDQEDGRADGAPRLRKGQSYAAWARILSADYEQLCKEVRNHVEDVMDAYGATNPAEFFAVATETFFEKPKLLKKKHPGLYRELSEYYGVDPGQW